MTLLGPLFDENDVDGGDDNQKAAVNSTAKKASNGDESSSTSKTTMETTTTTSSASSSNGKQKKRKGKELANAAGPSTSSNSDGVDANDENQTVDVTTIDLTASKEGNGGGTTTDSAYDDPLRFLQRTVTYRPDWDVDDAWAMACAWVTLSNTTVGKPLPQKQRGRKQTIVEEIQQRRNSAIKRKREEISGEFDIDPPSNVYDDDDDDLDINDFVMAATDFHKPTPTSTKSKRPKISNNKKYQQKRGINNTTICSTNGCYNSSLLSSPPPPPPPPLLLGTTATTMTSTTSTTATATAPRTSTTSYQQQQQQQKGTSSKAPQSLMTIDLASKTSNDQTTSTAHAAAAAKSADTAGSSGYKSGNDRGNGRGRGGRGRNWWRNRREGHAQKSSNP